MNEGRALPRSGNFLLVASTGGHLTQLRLIADLLQAGDQSHWVTFASPQTESLLAGRSRSEVGYVGPRQWWRTLKTVPTFVRLLRGRRFDAVISTGAAIAVPALVLAVLSRTPAYYVESVSRVQGPSMSGRMLRLVPGVHTFTQHKAWSSRQWHYDVSVLDAHVAGRGPRGQQPGAGVRRRRSDGGPVKVFVTLGTIKPYRFDALVDAVVAATADEDAQVTWQLGCTSRDDLVGAVHDQMPAEEFQRTALEADVVVTHAGVATCLQLVQWGLHPVVVPRRRSRGEHVDDHQVQIAHELSSRELCDYLELSDDTPRVMKDVFFNATVTPIDQPDLPVVGSGERTDPGPR